METRGMDFVTVRISFNRVSHTQNWERVLPEISLFLMEACHTRESEVTAEFLQHIRKERGIYAVKG